MNATKSIGSNWKDALIDALDGNPLGTTEKLRVEQERWESGSVTMTWSSPSWGEINIALVGGLRFGKSEQHGRLLLASEILLGGRETKRVTLHITAKANAGVSLLRTQKEIVEDVTNVDDHRLPVWTVPVTWIEGQGHNLPQTRQPHEDNFDLIFIDHEGCFRQLEISITTRVGKFWLAIQELTVGQVARTTEAKATKLGVTTTTVSDSICFVAPLYPENAYPGADWLKTSGVMGQKVVAHAIGRGASVPLSKCHVAEWSPVKISLPETMKANGWKVGTATWFNVPCGYGFVRCHDGTSCFCHFKQILDETGRPVASAGKFPSIPPMREIAIKWAEEVGKRKATAIRVLPLS